MGGAAGRGQGKYRLPALQERESTVRIKNESDKEKPKTENPV
jgi:hypothetical protein